MKKNFTLLTMLVWTVLATKAQSFEFRYGGQPLDDGSTVTIVAEPDSFVPDEKNCMTNPPSDPKNGLVLVTLDGSQKSGDASLEIVSNTLSPTLIQWCMGGICELMTNKSFLEKTFTTSEDGIVKVEFDANNVATEGLLEAKLSARIGDETRTVAIKFVPEETNRLSAPMTVSHDNKHYTIQGVLINSTADRKGVYIQDGKKYMKR